MDGACDAYVKIVERSLGVQSPSAKDWIDDEGVLHCGVCGYPKRKWVMAPSLNDPSGSRKILVGVMCKCAKEREEKQKRHTQATKEMQIVSSLKKASLMADKFADASLDKFQVTKYNERNLKLCKRYIEAWDKMVAKNQGLLFWGDVGTGKSYTAACIANALIARQVPAVMTSFVKLLEMAHGNSESESALISRICRAKLVVFDDLGAERNSDYVLEKVYNIVDSRYRSELPMIITTNLDVDTMKKETDTRYSRIYDRIFETCYPMQFTGPSWRRKSASKRYYEMESLLASDE